MKHPFTPDKRYLVVRGKLWRAANPALPPEVRKASVDRLMTARRAVRDALQSGDDESLARARNEVDEAKVALRERGPVWWTDFFFALGDQYEIDRHLLARALDRVQGGKECRLRTLLVDRAAADQGRGQVHLPQRHLLRGGQNKVSGTIFWGKRVRVFESDVRGPGWVSESGLVP